MQQQFETLKNDLATGQVKRDLRGEGMSCCVCIEQDVGIYILGGI